MPFARPTLDQILSRIQADLDSRLPGADARLRRSVLDVLAKVLAGGQHQLYGYLDWISRQTLPDTAESEQLDRHATIWGVTRKAATYASGTAIFSGQNGSVVPVGTELLRSDGLRYLTQAEGLISGGTATIAIECLESGTAGNGAGVQGGLVSPIAGVQSAVTLSAGGGEAQEGDEALRGRILRRIQQPPHGGAAFDYVTWALQVPGVTRAWCLPQWMGLGTVGLTFVCDQQTPTIIPDSSMVEEVQAWIDGEDVRPVTADVYVFAPTSKPLDITIAGLSPDTPSVRAQIEAEIQDLLTREAAPGATILLSHLREAISIAAGEHDHALTAPSNNFVCAPHELAILGVITWS